MSQPYVGEIRMVGFNFAPRGWMLCNGQLLPIQQYTPLFSLIGTTYGGNGTTTFALPNLQGRVPIHQGTLTGGATYVMGENAGTENVTLLSNQMPMHTHLMAVNNTPPSTADTPKGNYLGAQARGGTNIYAATTDSNTLNPQALGTAGGNQPHSNMQPYLCVNFIIALNGVFPSRN